MGNDKKKTLWTIVGASIVCVIFMLCLFLMINNQERYLKERRERLEWGNQQCDEFRVFCEDHAERCRNEFTLEGERIYYISCLSILSSCYETSTSCYSSNAGNQSLVLINDTKGIIMEFWDLFESEKYGGYV